jgi:hypothetical protein
MPRAKGVESRGPLRCPNPLCNFGGQSLEKHYSDSPQCRAFGHERSTPCEMYADEQRTPPEERLRKTFVATATAKLQDRLLHLHADQFLGPGVLEAAAAYAAFATELVCNYIAEHTALVAPAHRESLSGAIRAGRLVVEDGQRVSNGLAAARRRVNHVLPIERPLLAKKDSAKRKCHSLPHTRLPCPSSRPQLSQTKLTPNYNAPLQKSSYSSPSSSCSPKSYNGTRRRAR